MPRWLKTTLIYGTALAAGTALLELLDYQRAIRSSAGDVQLFLVAGGFMILGVWLGLRVLRPLPRAFDGNPQAQAALGISPRERAVLEQLATGLSNKEIARVLDVSPNTVKTHVARLFEKLEAARRTEAIARARALGLIP